MSKPKLHTIQAGYFPNALEAIAHHAQYGNDKHNPGEPLHWAYNKSKEHLESAQRHLAKAGTIDPETGESHTIGAAMRILMALETELLESGAIPGFAVEFSSAEPEERWGVFTEDGYLLHGQVTVLPSAATARASSAYRDNQEHGAYVARLRQKADGSWVGVTL